MHGCAILGKTKKSTLRPVVVKKVGDVQCMHRWFPVELSGVGFWTYRVSFVISDSEQPACKAFSEHVSSLQNLIISHAVCCVPRAGSGAVRIRSASFSGQRS